MTEENEHENPAEEVKEHVEEVAEEHPAIPKEEHHESHESHAHVTAHIDAMGEKIISAINSLKEVAPVTEKDIPLPDETPVRKPWTHRWIGK